MIHLTRTDPASNMARFYRLDVQRDLFAAWTLVAEWGRIGQGGRVRLLACTSQADAEAAERALAARKTRRGYRSMQAHPSTSPVAKRGA